MRNPLEKLEKMFMEEFLRSRSHTWETVNVLPEAERKKIMTEASTFVGVKLAEAEGKAHMADEIHGSSKTE